MCIFHGFIAVCEIGMIVSILCCTFRWLSFAMSHDSSRNEMKTNVRTEEDSSSIYVCCATQARVDACVQLHLAHSGNGNSAETILDAVIKCGASSEKDDDDDEDDAFIAFDSNFVRLCELNWKCARSQ